MTGIMEIIHIVQGTVEEISRDEVGFRSCNSNASAADVKSDC
jgi:hypothetical protein